jgi:hypothetical protein
MRIYIPRQRRNHAVLRGTGHSERWRDCRRVEGGIACCPAHRQAAVALWNALPGVENRRRVGDREALIDQLWSAIEALPDPGAIAPRGSGAAVLEYGPTEILARIRALSPKSFTSLSTTMVNPAPLRVGKPGCPASNTRIHFRDRLSAGGKWTNHRYRGISYRFETDFCRLHDGSRSRRDPLLSRRGTYSSNPSLSSRSLLSGPET